jgi:hypothetical protein
VPLLGVRYRRQGGGTIAATGFASPDEGRLRATWSPDEGRLRTRMEVGGRAKKLGVFYSRTALWPRRVYLTLESLRCAAAFHGATSASFKLRAACADAAAYYESDTLPLCDASHPLSGAARTPCRRL